MKKAIKWLDRNFELFILMVMLVAFSSVMMVQIIMRYIFKSPFTWAEEFCRYAFVASIAFISSFCVRANVLLKVDAIVNALPKPVQKALRLLMWAVMIAVYAILAIRGVSVVSPL
jgi:TRAP-type C4-dicarboxylate transport system permease small subunit